jgi:hypothetical protein
MLEEYIAHFGSPKEVLIVHGYDMWSRDINISVLSKIPGSWWSRRPNLGLGVKDRIRVFLNRYIPLYAETASLGWVIRHPGSAFQSRLPVRPDGFMVESTADPDQVEQDAEVHRQFVRQQENVLSAVNQAALLRIVELADANGFDVYLAGGPKYDLLAADSAFRAYYAALRDTLIVLTSASPRIHVLQRKPLTFSADQMQSADHIVYSGAVLFTAQLARMIESLRIGNDSLSATPDCR